MRSTGSFLSAASTGEGKSRPVPPDRRFQRRRLARHIPIEGGRAVEFVDLAARSRGATLLGVLKADADDLGAFVGRRLAGAADLRPLRELSEALDGFFAEEIDAELRRPAWSNLYTVFGGGDDLLLIGPWDVVLDFAGHLRGLFTRRFSSDGLTISAGVALVKPKLPIKIAARQADDLLDAAKSEPTAGASRAKDQMACLGGVWKWRDHGAVLGAGKRLAGLVDEGVVRRAWLHTLLELALLRHGPAVGGGCVPPAAATSRLAYHIARNWPHSGDKDPRRRAARAWVDGVAWQFDNQDCTGDANWAHLPSIIRYAMLATRRDGHDGKETHHE